MKHVDIYRQTAGTINNITMENIKSDEDHEVVMASIDKETKRRVALVPDCKAFGVMTACWIDGEFITTSNYDLPDTVRSELEQRGDIVR